MEDSDSDTPLEKPVKPVLFAECKYEIKPRIVELVACEPEVAHAGQDAPSVGFSWSQLSEEAPKPALAPEAPQSQVETWAEIVADLRREARAVVGKWGDEEELLLKTGIINKTLIESFEERLTDVVASMGRLNNVGDVASAISRCRAVKRWLDVGTLEMPIDTLNICGVAGRCRHGHPLVRKRAKPGQACTSCGEEVGLQKSIFRCPCCMAVCNLYCGVCANRATLEERPECAIRSALESRGDEAARPLLRLLSARLVNSSAKADGAVRYVADKAMVALFGGSRGRLIKWICDDRKDVASVLHQLYPGRIVNQEFSVGSIVYPEQTLRVQDFKDGCSPVFLTELGFSGADVCRAFRPDHSPETLHALGFCSGELAAAWETAELIESGRTPQQLLGLGFDGADICKAVKPMYSPHELAELGFTGSQMAKVWLPNELIAKGYTLQRVRELGFNSVEVCEAYGADCTEWEPVLDLGAPRLLRSGLKEKGTRHGCPFVEGEWIVVLSVGTGISRFRRVEEVLGNAAKTDSDALFDLATGEGAGKHQYHRSRRNLKAYALKWACGHSPAMWKLKGHHSGQERTSED